MDVSPKTLREVEFREKMRGYHPEDVDQFLEQVAVGLEVLQDRLRQAVDRAQRAEQAASDVGGSDETLRKTLVLAQRTADLAVQEAREQAARILAGAEQQAQAMLADGEDRARRSHENALIEVRSELSRLEGVRAQGQQDVDALKRWIEEHRTHLSAALTDALSAVERAGTLSPPPVSRPIETPAGPRPSHFSTLPAPPADPSEANASGPPTAAWKPSEEDAPAPAPPGEGDPYFAQLRQAVNDGDPLAPRPDGADGTGDQALDDFFDEEEFADDRKFGGRLRRRR